MTAKPPRKTEDTEKKDASIEHGPDQREGGGEGEGLSAERAAKGKTTAKGSIKKRELSPREQKIQEIKKKLIIQKSAILSGAGEALAVLPGQTTFPDLGDQASAEVDTTFMLRLKGREQKLLKKIEEAIEKIESGVFGVCEVCGQEIDIKRLEARPVTSMCILCKTEQEEEERLKGN
jgi:DnaK suppressor protein